MTLYAAPAQAQQRVVSAHAGLITRAEGEALYHCHEKGEGGEQLPAGAMLHDGDLVYTSKGGRVTWALNSDSYMTVSAESVVRVYTGALDRMHFDIERGEVIVVSRSLGGGASLVIHAPPGFLTVYKPGRYLFRVAEGSETEASVEKGELRYEEKGKTLSVKLADAGHMLTDVAGLGLALLAIRFAERPATPERTYGYYRVEILAALANAVVLIGISIYVLYEAYERFRHPPQVQSGAMLLVALVGLAVNVAGIFILRAGAQESLNMKGAYFEVLSDLLTSVGVIVAGLVMLTTGWYYADPLISAGIGLFILPRTWMLLRDAVGVLLEGTPSDVNLTELRQAVEGVEGVTGAHDLHIWSLTSGVNAMSVHVVRADGALHDDVLAGVRARVTSDFKIAHATVQVESVGCEAHETHL